ncbi:MAG: outer membrane protein, partial [Pseudolabrys sp.]
VGYAWGSTLLYVKGGGAWTRNDASSTLFNGAGAVLSTSTGTDDRSGWTIGGGLEYAFTQNWSARVEYDYYDFGTATVTRLSSTGTVNTRSNSLTLNAVKLAINYKFF